MKIKKMESRGPITLLNIKVFERKETLTFFRLLLRRRVHVYRMNVRATVPPEGVQVICQCMKFGKGKDIIYSNE